MSATKDKKNCSRGFAKTGKGQGFLGISVKVVDCYSNFDFVVAKWKVFCMQAIIISPWVRDFLARQVKQFPVIFWIVILLVLASIIYTVQKFNYNKKRGKTGNSEGSAILVRFIKYYSTFDFAVKKTKSLWLQMPKLCYWVENALKRQDKWLPVILWIVILLVLFSIIYIMQNLSKKPWIIQVKLCIYRVLGYLWLPIIYLWLQALMQILYYMLPP